jgi:two-component system, NtrC family, response regulator AtoC
MSANAKSASPPPETVASNVPTELKPPRRLVLLAEDSESTRNQLQKLLESSLDVQVDTVADGSQALKALTGQPYSILLTDLNMPRVDGRQLLQEVQKRGLPVTVIVTTGFGSVEDAVQAMRLGAYDFLTKPLDVQHLTLVMERALRERSLQDEVAALRGQLQDRFSFQNILSKNPRMHAIFELIGHVAHTTTTVLIEGETGTGKEQVARAIHHASSLRTGPLIAVNCAALPENLLESELFGHEKGSFTSAVSQRRGRFELADGGTLFLDEVGDVPPPMQAKLLRVLQERRFERVGGTESIEVDVRVIAATNRSLLRLVQEGKFREDLYYRLNVVKLDLPPLRDRPEDIPLLATHFAQKYARPNERPRQVTPEAMEVLLAHGWPGNIRELENAIERASVTSRDEFIRPENLPRELTAPPRSRTTGSVDIKRPLAELVAETTADLERRYLRRMLKKCRGNIGRCAKLSGLSRRTITDKVATYKIDRKEFLDA